MARIDHEHRSYMPSDYATKLAKPDLDDLISHLISVAAETKSQKTKTAPTEDEE